MSNIVTITDSERAYWQKNPVEWIETFLDVKLWGKQKEIVESVTNNDLTTVRSGNGIGKSFVAACILLQRLFCYPGSKTVSTAPTQFQVKDVLWGEVRKLHSRLKEKIDPAGYLTQVRLVLSDDLGWWAVGRATDEGEKLIGTHERNLLIIFDEASGISNEIFDAAEALTTAHGNKQLLIGNPWKVGTHFHATHTSLSGYSRIHVSVLDSPNIKKIVKDGKVHYEDNLDENGNLVYPDLSSMKWINRQRDTYGEKSAGWTIKVLGEFPTISTDALIDGKWLAAAVQKGIFLRKTVKALEEGSEIYDSTTVRKLMGK